jgi:hypothetical protein
VNSSGTGRTVAFLPGSGVPRVMSGSITTDGGNCSTWWATAEATWSSRSTSAARLELFGGTRLRRLLDASRETHHAATYELQVLIDGHTSDDAASPVFDMSDFHDHLDAAIRADDELRAALVEAIQERPSLRLDLAEAAKQSQRHSS